MNTPWVWLTVAAGLAVRIGIPLLVLVTMVLVMRRLDKRWQSESKPPAPQLPAEPPCWEASTCASPACDQCAVHQNPETPCWQQFRDQDGNLRAKCLACELFAAVPVPQPAREEHPV